MVSGSTTTYAISATITPNIVRVRIPLMQGLFDTTFIFYVSECLVLSKEQMEKVGNMIVDTLKLNPEEVSIYF
jgi:hypothetical protein